MKYTITVLLFTALFSNSFEPDLRPFQWIIGIWEMPKSNGGAMLEIWKVKDAKTLSGQGLRVSGEDTTLLENISLYADKEVVWYAPVVTGQNNGQAVPFKLVASKNNQYTFENPEHDFPKRIVYEFKPLNRAAPLEVSPGDTMEVAVTDLKGEGIHFRFTRK